jgi:glutamine amidotransferase
MCRLLGIVASELTDFGVALTGAPRCLATLSREHPDGWGIAVHEATTDPAPESDRAKGDEPWRVHKGTAPAAVDARFHDLAARSRGHLLVAHVRQKTVGPTRLENSHPFVRDGWVFAHNGTIKDQDMLRAGCSGRRLREITGDTDSELFFAFVLTRLDDRGLVRPGDERARVATTELIHRTTAELRDARIGAFNFLLSDGQTTYAHRFGRSLFVLERGPADPVPRTAPPISGTSLTTRWTSRRPAVLIASERITDEPWREVPDSTLLRIDRTPSPHIVSTTSDADQRAAS